MTYALFLFERGSGWVNGGEFTAVSDAKAEAARRLQHAHNPGEVREVCVVQILERAKPLHSLIWT